MKVKRTRLEEFFEKNDVKIQIVFIIVSLSVGMYFDICQENELGVIIGLLLLISEELISLSVKDGIAQKKLDCLSIQKKIENGTLFRVHDFDLTSFFESTRSQFYISGMALNGFFKNNLSTIGNLLREGKEVCVLIAAPDAIVENAKLYHGTKHNKSTLEEKENDLFCKQIITLNYIKEISDIFDAIEEGRFKLRVANAVFSTSFVAYDIFEDVPRNKVGKELKASFYQYKCINPMDEPNIVVDSVLSKEWYLFFKEIIKMQWEDATPISSKEEFDELLKKINGKIYENSNQSTGKVLPK